MKDKIVSPNSPSSTNQHNIHHRQCKTYYKDPLWADVLEVKKYNRECWNNRWLNNYDSNPRVCWELIKTKPECNQEYFNHAGNGDGNCGCVTDTSSTCDGLNHNHVVNIMHYIGGTEGDVDTSTDDPHLCPDDDPDCVQIEEISKSAGEIQKADQKMIQEALEMDAKQKMIDEAKVAQGDKAGTAAGSDDDANSLPTDDPHLCPENDPDCVQIEKMPQVSVPETLP
jgi:hypothetical protein